MRNTVLIPSQEFHHSPSRSPQLMDLLLPPVDQQQRVYELLEWLVPDACDVAVDIACKSVTVFTERMD
ncbi:MAG: hypothetical protein WBX11_16565 [Thiobacillaceae bacterium]